MYKKFPARLYYFCPIEPNSNSLLINYCDESTKAYFIDDKYLKIEEYILLTDNRSMLYHPLF